MADVFISYKRDEKSAIERIAKPLRELGLKVWFDASMSAGDTFNSEIDREARAAKSILVCWSPTARESRWVIAEAMIGFEQDKLAACHVAGPDGFSPPTPFNTTHAEDLRAWLAAPSETHAGWKSVLRRIGKLCARPDIESWGALGAQASAEELRAWIRAHEQSPLFMTVEAMLRDREAQNAERERLEKIARERQAREEAERRAREDAARKVQEEAERRAQAERRHADAYRGAAARRKGVSWPLIVGGGVIAAIIVVVGLNLAGSQRESSRERAQLPTQPSTVTPSDLTVAEAPTPTVEELDAARSASFAAREFDDCNGAGWCPTMIEVPAGTFMIGSPPQERGRNSYEGPQLSISIRSLAVGRFEITRAQWAAFVGTATASANEECDVSAQAAARGVTHRSWRDPGYPQDDRHPVACVSWRDVQAYLRWLSQRTGQEYRLLTEAEWEYAARAGTTSPYWFGEAITRSDANYGDGTTAVGTYRANPFGLHDTAGNVGEWVEDCSAFANIHPGHSGKEPDGSAYLGGNCSYRIVRGGSWGHGPIEFRSASRSWTEATNRNHFTGFRVARNVG